MKKRFFDLAKRLSRKSDYNSQHLGAVITRGNEIVGIGFNKRKTHPLSQTRFNNIHAELSAVINAGREDLTGCSIYVYRESKSGKMGLAKPCAHCMNLLKRVNIGRVHYSTYSGFETEEVR